MAGRLGTLLHGAHRGQRPRRLLRHTGYHVGGWQDGIDQARGLTGGDIGDAVVTRSNGSPISGCRTAVQPDGCPPRRCGRWFGYPDDDGSDGAAKARAYERSATQARIQCLRRPGVALAKLRLPSPSGRAGIAVHAALSRLGRPYVWGATGPNQFDCSGLVQWAYAQAGVHLDRTTYQQINEGIPVPRSQVRPGDLVFPHPGHVQLAIGNNLVVEAPHAGASVRVSSLGNNVQIRRPLSGR